MADLLHKQLQVRHSIERSLDNLRKLGRKNQTPALLRSRLKALKEFWLQFQNGHSALHGAIASEQKASIDYFREDHFDKTEDVYLSTMDYIHERLEEMEPVIAHDTTLDQSHAQGSHPASVSHLPPVNIPPYDGSYEEWETFRDHFHAMIIANRELSNATRMHYLASSLRGRALECIKGIAVTSDNFEFAWKQLTARFEDKRRLLTRHLTALFKMPVLTRESANDLNRISDYATANVTALQNLNRTAGDLWNDMLVHMVTQNLDSTTQKAWNLKTTDGDIPPTFQELIDFLAYRARALEKQADLTSISANSGTRGKPIGRVHVSSAVTSHPLRCPACHSNHQLYSCPQFLGRTINQRRELVKNTKRCYNCLSPQHAMRDCKSKHACRICRKRHHTLLHVAAEASRSEGSHHQSATAQIPQLETKREVVSLCSSMSSRARGGVLLETAWLSVRVPSGRMAIVRAMLDTGSEMTLISENLAQLLRVSRIRMPIEISAVGGVSAGVHRHATRITVSPQDDEQPAFSTMALILPTLTKYSPRHLRQTVSLTHLAGLLWADRNPLSSDPIDVIIGADLYNDVKLDGFCKGAMGLPSAQKTIFGWVISGSVPNDRVTSRVMPGVAGVDTCPERITAHHCKGSIPIDQALHKFWEVEDIPQKSILSPQDDQCEQHFLTTHSRQVDGRYVVRLPFKKGPPIDIGESKTRAARVLDRLTRQLVRNPVLHQDYANFLRDYEDSSHMARISDEAPSTQCVYLPHHPVYKESSITTQLRVVFNASCITTNGSSLNDHLLTGPKLQTELSTVLLRWRQHRYVYTADIRQMYRQIRVDERDLDYQRILWSPSTSEVPQSYRLLTVTYGMAAAPFLALRVLRQLVHDDGHRYPLAVPVLTHDIYIDDVLFGDDDPHRLRQTREQLQGLLQSGGFQLRKWASNSVELLSDLDADRHGLACDRLLQGDEQVKVLGVRWSPACDSFQFCVALTDASILTKRRMLSEVAKLFDPLGWATPVIITAKIFMQHLWRCKLDWDEPCSADLLHRWQSIYGRLAALHGQRVPRWTGQGADTVSITLHGYADASSVAYAAVAYLRSVSRSGQVKVALLTAKSKVAPFNTTSIPRLELMAALLLARLLVFVRESLASTELSMVCWTDSTVVLAWLSRPSSTWKTFIANRVAEIQTIIPSASWRHVGSHDNPADCASRGVLGDELASRDLWWNGPSWLILPEDRWPTLTVVPDRCLEAHQELRASTSHHLQAREPWILVDRYSSWSKLLRVTSYIMRFIKKCRRKGDLPSSPPVSSLALSASELREAKVHWMKHMQAELFPAELQALRLNQPLARSSSLLALTPFLDGEGLIRVGGRLQAASMSYAQKHPVILASHPLTKLLIWYEHVRMLHAGATLLHSTLRQSVWLLRSRGLIRAMVHRCVRCARERSAIPTQLMGSLPAPRVSPPTRTFQDCGLDYAGPVQIRASVGRGIRSIKAYVALFVCLATKAIHLELVGSCTTPSFLDAFTRFCSRRGLPHAIYSDNGTTFVGAQRELTASYRCAIRSPEFLNRLAMDNITWHFIPPSAPHFGGLWEAGVRSLKYHLRRIVGSHTLSYEEFATVLCRIEACLNSRPLAPLSDACDDLSVLTPGHFLIGSALNLHPEPSTLEVPENRLTRWQLIRRLSENLWKQWANDYVTGLQQRSKWKRPGSNMKVGQLVLLRNPALPPCKWELGRITRCHPGNDGLIRVVTIKTATSEFKRPIVKVCLLPVDIETQGNRLDSNDEPGTPS